MAAASRLRDLLETDNNIVVCPGVYDGFTARMALNAGLDAVYMTGAGTMMSRLGMADLGVASLNDMKENAGMIAKLDRSVPLIADVDTGYGGPLMVGRTIEEYMQAGVAALHLEDQVIVDTETFVARIRAAVNKRRELGGDIVIIARTDALQSLGYEAAVSRLKAAIKAGADVAFLEGFTNKEDGRRVCKELSPTPVLLNMVGGGVTPDISVTEARDLGFKAIIYPCFAMIPVYQAVTAAAKELRDTGDLKVVGKPKIGPKELFEVCGPQEMIEFDVAAGGKLFSNGV
ncbi:oxaloacetate hydrolase class protein [Cadophora sp. DSE1049]|nr:oxaloacetate hydrolase class protein [Cadophora sp. DSE1049]